MHGQPEYDYGRRIEYKDQPLVEGTTVEVQGYRLPPGASGRGVIEKVWPAGFAMGMFDATPYSVRLEGVDEPCSFSAEHLKVIA